MDNWTHFALVETNGIRAIETWQRPCIVTDEAVLVQSDTGATWYALPEKGGAELRPRDPLRSRRVVSVTPIK